MNHSAFNMDKLYESVANKGHVCVGLDTATEYVPPCFKKWDLAYDVEAIREYNTNLVDETIGIAACYKVQIAYYEEGGPDGLRLFADTLRYIRMKGGLVIADVKRGDIADTASRYAKAYFGGRFDADFATLLPYMGMDSIDPWAKVALDGGRSQGAFVVMHSSNPGREDFQYFENSDGKKLYEKVGNKLVGMESNKMGANGYRMFGAVVGCTDSQNAIDIRTKYPELFFLVPGYGAQGGKAEDCAKLMDKNGNGGVVNSSRAILKAWEKQAKADCLPLEEISKDYALAAARQEVINMRDAIRAACIAARDQK